MEPNYQKLIKQLTESTAKFLEPLTLEGTYQIIVSEAIKLNQADYGTIFLAKNGKLERVYSTVPQEFQVEPRKDGYNAKVFKTGKPVLIKRSSFLSVHPDFKNQSANFIIGIALRNRGKSIGTLFLQSKRLKPFTKFDLEILTLMGSFASLAIRKAELYAEIKNALDTRDFFIATANHEIKTPLTAINIYSQMIKNAVAKGELPKEQWADKMSHEVKRVSKLLIELLKIEQINTGDWSYVLRETDLSETIKKSIDTFKQSTPNRAVRFTNNLKHKSFKIQIDSDKITQAIINLLNNAAKFSPPSSPILVKLSAYNEKLSIKIEDRGEGIAEDIVPHIFKGFYKGDPSKPGYGLGLYLTKKIIERHGGEIIVSSKKDQGTTMEITLPYKSNGQI